MNSIRCRQCEHYIEANAGEGKIYGCDRSRCVFEPTTKNNLGVEEVTALAEWTEKLTKASEEAYNKGYADGIKELQPITTKDKFEYALTACSCLWKDGKTWYEHNELIECFENLGLLENPHAKNKESMTTKQKYLVACDYALHQLIKTGSSQLSIIKGDTWDDVPFAEVLNWLEEEYKQTNAESEENNGKA